MTIEPGDLNNVLLLPVKEFQQILGEGCVGGGITMAGWRGDGVTVCGPQLPTDSGGLTPLHWHSHISSSKDI